MVTLEKSQEEAALVVWRQYKSTNRVTFINAKRETTPEEIDKERQAQIPVVKQLIDNFISGKLPLDDFKTRVDSTNKRHPVWGFAAINGMMFFNVLTNASANQDKKTKFEGVLKEVISAPSNLSSAGEKINNLHRFTDDLRVAYEDRRGAPKVGSIPYFLSYFWHIQAPYIFPIYYNSMIDHLETLEIWKPIGIVEEDYKSFYDLIYLLMDLFSREEKVPVGLWEVGHAFWFHKQLNEEVEPSKRVPHATHSRATKESKENDFLPESFIPPVVSIIPALAKNDPDLAALCSKSGTSIEKIFESRLALLFQMLGFMVEELGQGQGRVPDGFAINQEYRYAIIYDAKIRQDGYSMGTDDRAIKEYINEATDRLRKRGFRNVYFMIISSRFSGDHDSMIRSLKLETDIKEVLFMEAKALIELLQQKLRDPEFSFGPDGFQHLLASSGTITAEDIQELVG